MKTRVLIASVLSGMILVVGIVMHGVTNTGSDLVHAHGAVAVANGMQQGDASQVIAGRSLQQATVWPLILLFTLAAIALVWVLLVAYRPKRPRGIPPAAVIALFIVPVLLAACGSPQGSTQVRQVPIGASETAFVVDASVPADQTQLQASAFVQEKAILTGQVPITYEEYKSFHNTTGPLSDGWAWKANNFVYLLDRAPVTREWTAVGATGTSDSNQAFALKSVDDIAYSVEMNCTGQVAETNAALFLSIYGGTDRKALPDPNFKQMPDAVFSVGAIGSVMDRNVRGEFQGRLSAAFGPLPVAEARKQFGAIITKTVVDVSTDFLKNGLTLLNCGAVGTLNYVDANVQNSANQVAVAQQAAGQQAILNQKDIDQAKAQATVKQTGYDVELKYVNQLAAELKDNPQVAQYLAAQKWNGVAPTTVVGSSGSPPFIQIGTPGVPPPAPK